MNKNSNRSKFIELKEKLLDELSGAVFYEDVCIEKIANAFEISKDDVQKCFTNGHYLRGILAYVLCKCLNEKFYSAIKIKDDEDKEVNVNIHWTVEYGVGEHLYLRCLCQFPIRIRPLLDFSFHVQPNGENNYFLAKYLADSNSVAFCFIS
ncbi:MAG: hypothetical protein IIT46_14860 [Lachnospiraceae bacterium]|nr:hypothetical protein [Lachnospiraceae bacterium]